MTLQLGQKELSFDLRETEKAGMFIYMCVHFFFSMVLSLTLGFEENIQTES